MVVAGLVAVAFGASGCGGAVDDTAEIGRVEAGAPSTVAATAPPAPPATTAPPATAAPVPGPTPLDIPTPAPTPRLTPDPLDPSTPEPVVSPLATSGAAGSATTVPTTLPADDGATPPPPTMVPPVPETSDAVLAANGAEVYTLNCARCHAENGLGTQLYAASLIGVGSRYSTAGMITELTTGHPVTFGFADRLSSDEIASVVAYVKATFP